MEDTGTLFQRTHRLLHERDATLSLMDIYDATGISFHWLTKFAAGKITDPSVNTVQRLYEYLAKKPLKV